MFSGYFCDCFSRMPLDKAPIICIDFMRQEQLKADQSAIKIKRLRTKMKRLEFFSDRLQYLIDLKNFKQADVTVGIEVQPSRISDWLKGKPKNPRRKSIRLLSTFFGCDIEWLATGEGKPFPTRSAPPSPGDKVQSIDQAGQLEETLAQLKRVQFKQAFPGYLNELTDFIGDVFGEDKAGVRQFLANFVEPRGESKQWKREREQRA